MFPCFYNSHQLVSEANGFAQPQVCNDHCNYAPFHFLPLCSHWTIFQCSLKCHCCGVCGWWTNSFQPSNACYDNLLVSICRFTSTMCIENVWGIVHFSTLDNKMITKMMFSCHRTHPSFGNWTVVRSTSLPKCSKQLPRLAKDRLELKRLLQGWVRGSEEVLISVQQEMWTKKNLRRMKVKNGDGSIRLNHSCTMHQQHAKKGQWLFHAFTRKKQLECCFDLHHTLRDDNHMHLLNTWCITEFAFLDAWLATQQQQQKLTFHLLQWIQHIIDWSQNGSNSSC